jgi:hypothetical protein
MAYNVKYEITRYKIREIKYSLPVRECKKKRVDYSQRKEGEKSTASLYRTRNNIVNTIDANVNYFSKFITLTTKQTVLDRDVFINYFNNFKKQFSRIFGEKLLYIGVLERQRERGRKEGNEGSLHIHLVVFNSKKLDFNALKRCWPVGSVDVKKIDTVANLGVYMAKYITKDSIKEFQKRLIFKSKGLKKPLTIKGWNGIDLINYYTVKKIAYNKKYFVGYGNNRVGTATITEYIIADNRK